MRRHDCPACAAYDRTTRDLIRRGNSRHWAELDRIRAAEVAGVPITEVHTGPAGTATWAAAQAVPV